MITISPIYIALCALLYMCLAVRVVRQRYTARTTHGDGGDKELRKRIRAHGNLSEYAPMLLLMLVVMELQGSPGYVLHLFGALILVSRTGHAYFISQTPESIKMRTLTMTTTFALLGVMALGLLGHAIF
ncbi:MAPEG family protein [uncultured Litoreibacter sp.]|uniref:MAPEG family protein n=1 Tax=uncultured Litoreibacter sp. TaxID=1392394 RepID=UPI0026378EC9|nr:MAPEG family protein [uncultured Litoreibacter sp.]